MLVRLWNQTIRLKDNEELAILKRIEREGERELITCLIGLVCTKLVRNTTAMNTQAGYT